MTDSSRLNSRNTRIRATQSVVFSLAIALAILVLLGGTLAVLAHPLNARAADPLKASQEARVEAPAAVTLLSPPPAPALQAGSPTTLALSILSTPYATVDSNSPTAGPQVWAVEAVITNTGNTTALTPTIDLDMNPLSGWDLLTGESRQRTLSSLAPGGSQAIYWFARRPSAPGTPHLYSVTVWAANANTVTQQLNAFSPFTPTVQTRASINTGNTGLVSAGADVQVGVAFTMSVDYDLGTNPDGVTLQPVGDTSFDPSAYRLLSSETKFFDAANNLLGTYRDRLYFQSGSLPAGARRVRTTYTFIALRLANVTLCPYTDVLKSTNNKYDNLYCVGNSAVPITGTLTFSFTKSANATTVSEGELLTYTLRYTNTGSLPISNAYIWDNLPAQTSASSASPAPDPTFTTPDRVVWSIGTIGPSGTPTSTGQVTLTVLVDAVGADIPNGTALVNQGFMGILFNPADVVPAITSTITTTVQAPAIAISKSDGQENVLQGQVLTYTLRLTNTGSVPAANLLITDVLPAGVTYLGPANPPPGGQSGQTLTWTLLSLAGVHTIDVPVSVNNGLANGALLTNSMQVRYANQTGHVFDVLSAVDEDTVQSPIMAISKHDFPDPVIAGRNVTYTLLITNSGPAAANNVVITDFRPVSTTFVSCSGGSSPCGLVGNTIGWGFASIAPGSTESVTFTAKVTAGLASGTTIVNQDYGILSDETGFVAGLQEETTVVNAAAIVKGRAFNDTNGNGVLDGAETGIANVTVRLPGALQPVTSTNASGRYTFTLEASGSISVSADLPASFFHTTPSPVYLDVSLENTHAVDFGFAPTGAPFGAILGTVFEDANANGAQELGESGLAGVSLAAPGAVSTPIATNLYGQYVLSFTTSITHTVTETNPVNYVSTTPDSVAAAVASGGSSQVDFGDFPGVRIEGLVFDDANANGANDAEAGIPDVTVTGGDDSRVTGPAGTYTLFTHVQSGQPITITETDPAGYISTAAIPGSAAVSRIDLNTLQVDNPISGTVYSGNTFGDALATGVVTITGQIFDDANADGLYNDGGMGLADGRVTASTGMFVTTTTSGEFTVYGPAGVVITLTETNPPGYVSTNAIPGSAATKLNLDALRVGPLAANATSTGNYFGDVLPANAASVSGVLFNDANGNGVFDSGESTFSGQQVSISGTLSLITTTNATGAYAFAVGASTFVVGSGVPAGYYRTTPAFLVITTTLGGSYPNQNFGFSNNATRAAIFGTVFDDFNGNGLQDLGELGLPGAVLRLISGANTVATTTTGISGAYAFSVTQPGVWTVQETNPPGYYSTSPDRLNVSVTLGNSYQVNFGDSNRPAFGSVHGVVFNDINGNGVQGVGEAGIPGVLITTTADNGVDVVSATTGFAGQYTFGFDFVSQSFHTIREVNPTGYRSTTPDAVVVNIIPGAAQLVNFGDCQIGVCSSVIQGIVFNDANGDGGQDFAEPGLSGVTVSLYSGATLAASATTGPNGSYTFGGLAIGVYRVVETDPPSYHSTTPNEVHQSVGVTGTYVVNFGDSNNPFVSSIFGTVYNDANANALFDLSEIGIPNVPVRIAGNFGGNPITSTTTNLLGQYTFLVDAITPSNVFTVTETDLSGYGSTTANAVTLAVALNQGYRVNFGDVRLPVCAADAYEPNDNLFSTTGVTLTAGAPQTHNFYAPGDQDWLKVLLKRGDVYTFTTVAFGGRADTVLELYASNGTTRLAYGDDFLGSNNFSSRINWTARADGTHFLRVTPRNPALTGCLTDYSISMLVSRRYTLLLPLVLRSIP